MPQILDTSSFWSGALATKTLGLKAKHVSAVVSDQSVLSKMLLETLEGVGPIASGRMLCVGELGDIWLQGADKLIKKYNLTAIDDDGWMHFLPKPENEVEFFEVTQDKLASIDGGSPVYLQGTWGNTIDGIDNLQRFNAGDFIARQTYDHNDQWVVARKIWLNSYSAK